MELERFIGEFPAFPKPSVVHTFTPGLYSRKLTLPKDYLCTSKVHRTTHQFVISRGLLKIWSEEKGWELVQSPFHGITYAGSSRGVHVLEETVWLTFHSTLKTDIAEIETDLFHPWELQKALA